MESYKSDEITINYSRQLVFDKLSRPETFKTHLENNLDKLPEEVRQNLGQVSFGEDNITINTPMGPLKMAVTEKTEPGKIAFAATQSPVPFGMVINLEETGENTTQAIAELQLDLPIFLRSMVGGKIREGAKKFGEVLAMLPYDEL
ncbi:MAG: hypothetical protein J6X81_00555 [Muribaculaceae bacterium]|nr:hypothetical protein [Muribaculaceae bacterium]